MWTGVIPIQTTYRSFFQLNWHIELCSIHSKNHLFVKLPLYFSLSSSPSLIYNFLHLEGIFVNIALWDKWNNPVGTAVSLAVRRPRLKASCHDVFCILMAHDFPQLSKAKIYNLRKATRQLRYWTRAAGFTKGGTEGVGKAQRGHLFMEA